jgi:hypothetical protein
MTAADQDDAVVALHRIQTWAAAHASAS